MTFGNRVYVQNFLPILKQILSSGGDSSDPDDGRSKTIFTKLGGQVRTRTDAIPCILFVRRDAGGLFGGVFLDQPSEESGAGLMRTAQKQGKQVGSRKRVLSKCEIPPGENERAKPNRAPQIARIYHLCF